MTAPSRADVTAAFGQFLELLLDHLETRSVGGVTPTPSEYTAKSLPPGITRRTFNARCKRLAADGDPRVKKRCGFWVAQRSAIDETPRRRDHAKPAGDRPWSARGSLEDARARAQRG